MNFKTPESLPYLRLMRVVMFCFVPALVMLAVGSVVLPIGPFARGAGAALVEYWRTAAPLAALAPLMLGIAWIYRRERQIRARAARGLCFYCGYDMRETPEGLCPECGRKRG